MHIHFERNFNAQCDCAILSLSWMGKVPDELPEEEGWKLNRNNYYQEGWLATGNVRGVVGVTFTTSHSRRSIELPLRTNYNLRGHRSDVILVKWNEPYQKLASCDSSGVIFVWIKYEGRWSIELINDRSTPVTHFSWSHDGRMALICYQDGFVLVGSVAGQRYWSSMLTLEARITCGCWTPDDAHVYLGTAAGQLVVMDVHGAMVSQVQLMPDPEVGITGMAWSCEKFKMEESDEEGERTAANQEHVLAVAFTTAEVYILTGHDDVSPIKFRTDLNGKTLAMEWANSRELLAVAGSMPRENGIDSSQTEVYKNVVKFYSDAGILLHTVIIPYTESPVSSLTWGHAGRRLFVALGRAVRTARVWRAVAPLQLLARVRVAAALPRRARSAKELPLPPRLMPLVANLFANTIRCCVPESSRLRRFVSRPPTPPTRLYCTMLRHAGDELGAGYTLYLEHLGGLVPLLKGRRVSKIRPEFIIFDPQVEEEEVTATAGKRSASRETSSSGTSSSTSSSGTHAHAVTNSETSESDRDEGCSGSPRLERRRRPRSRRKKRFVNRNHMINQLTYLDTLPEDVQLVEVTSNIWGTKFKLHGISKSLPANLGQITYKTSLLHLQPRQMTLVITELRDDNPIGPDPNFNPNIFSEDEEESFNVNNNVSKNIVNTNNNNDVNKQREEINDNLIDNETPIVSRRDSLDEMRRCNPIVSEQLRHIPHTNAERRINTSTSVSNRHAISPLCCDGSVPTLQSPKNAVAPTDIIFERPSPQAVSCGGRGDFCSGRSDFCVRSDALSLKNSVEQSGFNLNLNVDRQYSINKTYHDGCIPKLRKNIGCRAESLGNCSKMATKNASPSDQATSSRRIESFRPITRVEDIKFIDDENAQSSGVVTELGSPVFPSAPPRSVSMPRSCSVGYLDLAANPEEPRRRLVLVQSKKNDPSRKSSKRKPLEKSVTPKKPGKSKSLDSSELTLALNMAVEKNTDNVNVNDSTSASKVDNDSVIKRIDAEQESPKETFARGLFSSCLTPQARRKARRDLPTCKNCKCVTPNSNERSSNQEYICRPCRLSANRNESVSQNDTERADSSSNGEFMWLESMISKLRSAPNSPRLPRSSPASPAPSRSKRNYSPSPIRQILNSPLLNRRRNKKQSESSDEEFLNQTEELINGKNYRDLESFQKAQLRNKLKQRGKSDLQPTNKKSSAPRRQLVMHNKAPMWNENSQVYQLDFGGRVTQESAKNFQIEFHGKQVMQFGRIDGNAYTLDFQYPFSALQAFAVALANVTQRLK